MRFISQYKKTFFVVIMFLLIILVSIPAYTIYTNTKSLIEEELGRAAMAVSISVAEIIAQDIESYKKLNSASSYGDGSYDETYYEEMQDIFRQLNDSTGVKYLYTEKKISEEKTIYILDGDEDFSPIGTVDYNDQYKSNTFETKEPGFSPMDDFIEWGELISGYAPIIDPVSDEVIGIVGADISADQIKAILSYLQTIISISFVLMLLIISYAIYKLIWVTADSIETDDLTGLSTKNYFENVLRRNIRNSKKSKIGFSVMMLDIDNFKGINDTFGHYFGDQVLRDVSNLLRKNTRNVDVCARYGGDEFICLLPSTNIESTEIIANRILASVSELVVDTDISPKPTITLSIGIYEHDQFSSYDIVIKSVDDALYKSKNNGRNQVSCF